MDGEVEQYCLRWKYHHSNLQFMFAQLLENQSLCDVTLVCEGKTLRVHKIMLSACSAYFDSIFSKYEDNDPIVILEGVRFEDLNALVDFMYRGEITVDKSRLNDLIETAEELQVKGLAAVSWKSSDEGWKSVSGRVSKELSTQDSNKEIKRKVSEILSTIAAKHKDEVGGEAASKVPSSPESVYPASKKRKITPNHNPQFNYSSSLSENDSDCEQDMKDPNVASELSSKNVPCDSSNGKNAAAVTCDSTPFTLGQGGGGGEKEKEKLPPPPDIPDLKGVTKMYEHIEQGGWRPHFWELETTKKVMEAIKNKKIEMKTGAELLGVTYGTLYGRYREVHGYLKQPQRDFWHDIRYTDVISKLKKKEISLFTAADILNINVTALASHLATHCSDSESGEFDQFSNQTAAILTKTLNLNKPQPKVIPLVQIKTLNSESPTPIPSSIIKVIESSLAKKAIKFIVDNKIKNPGLLNPKEREAEKIRLLIENPLKKAESVVGGRISSSLLEEVNIKEEPALGNPGDDNDNKLNQHDETIKMEVGVEEVAPPVDSSLVKEEPDNLPDSQSTDAKEPPIDHESILGNDKSN